MKVAIVHYHLEPSGVSRVIERASPELTRRGIAHVILVGKCPHDMANALPVVVVDGLAYSDASIDGQAAENILDTLRTTATEVLGSAPDLWHFHNHSLGKNRAIPLIVSMLASQNEQILLQIHDLAEDGRPENSPNIADIPYLYPLAPQIHYAFINSRDRNLFIKAGLSASNAHLIANPVFNTDSIPHTTSKTPNTPPLLLCPARGIRRKNIGELILLTLLAPKGTRCAITLAPENPHWLAIHDHWKKFCAAHHLPVEFAVVDRIAPNPNSAASFESWISRATHFITCSISEGFGFVFLESLAYGKPLIGREIEHISHDLKKHGIEHGRLYEKILIPADWLSHTMLEEHVKNSFTHLLQSWNREASADECESVMASMNHDGFFDFGNLPEALQQTVIEKLLDPEHHAIPILSINGRTQRLKAWIEDSLTQNQQTQAPQIPKGFTIATHCEQTIAIHAMMADQKPLPPATLDPNDILDAFLVAEEFQFLKSPLNQDIN